MIINKNSWHYKLVEYFDSSGVGRYNAPTNLCSYLAVLLLKMPVLCILLTVTGPIWVPIYLFNRMKQTDRYKRFKSYICPYLEYKDDSPEATK